MDNLWAFIDSNFFQTIILIITVSVTIWIYFYQKGAERRDAARVIVMQIDSIDQKTEQLVRVVGNDINSFDVERLWKIENVIENNIWQEYRHLFVKKLNYNEIVALNNYYDSVVIIKCQQSEIKRAISEENLNYLISHLQDSADKISEEGYEKHIRVPSMYLSTIQIEYDKIRKNREALPYERLKKIAKI